MVTESGGSTKPVAVIILGADAVLASRPATAIQLWHACLAAGYDLAVPATWGDELIAAECLRAVGSHPEPVTVMCSCPLVARALGDGDPDLSAHLVSLVAPPVATARYLRRVYGDRRVHLTYVGGCPAAGDSAIDSWLTPAELLERFTVNAIEVDRQPQLFESVLPPDRRRHLSLPGGVPAPERAASLARPRQVAQIDDDDVIASIRRHLMSGVHALVDVAPRFGCACSGAVAGVVPAEARLAVALVEPPRSARPVMADPVGLALLRRVPPRPPIRADAHPSGERPASEPRDHPATAREAERPVATSRTHARSPLSWNLRERALPQPPTSARPSGTSAGRGASSATWSAVHPPRSNGPAAGAPPGPTPGATASGSGEADAQTAAAIRALEAAARLAGLKAEPARRDAGASVGPAGRSDSAAPEIGRSHESGNIATGAPAAGDVREQDESLRPARVTPPGGYWFIPASAAPESDTEVARVADAGGDVVPAGGAVPDDSVHQENVASGLEAMFVQSAAPDPESSPTAATAAAPEPTREAIEEPKPASPSEPGQTPPPPDAPRAADGEGRPPDRAWIVTMTLIMVLAGALLARDVVQRRAGQRPSADRAAAGAVESVADGALQLPMEAVSGTGPAAAEPARGSVPPVVTPAARSVRARSRSSTAPAKSGAAADPVAVVPPPPEPAALAESARAVRDAEIRAIREELARRAARLDSMGRAIGSLFAVPRASPPRRVPPLRER